MKGALIFDPKTNDKIKDVIAYAKRNIFSLRDIRDMGEGLDEPAGDNPNRVVLIERGFKTVFNYEYQLDGLFRHISISHYNDLPPVIAAEFIIKEFGFCDLCDCHIYFEDHGNFKAINIMELIKENPEDE